MSLIDTVNEALLDKVYQLQKKRERIIEETGDFYSIGYASIRLKALREGSTFYFMPNSPVLPGMLIKHTDLLGCYIAKEVIEEAGRIRVEAEYLNNSTSIHTKTTKAVDPLGRVHYSTQPTGWTCVPFSLSGKKARLPRHFTPDRGDLLWIGDTYYEVKDLRFEGLAIVELALEEFA